MSPRDRPPVRTPSPRHPSGKDLGNQLSPPIWLCSSWNWTAVSSGQRRNGPPTEPGFSQGFFLRSVTNGVLVPLPLSPLACLVGDTSFPAISSTWLKQKLFWTELSWTMTSLNINNEMPLTEIECFNLVILHYWHYFPILILCSCFVTICIVKSAI